MPEHPGAAEQMMKCESAVRRGGVGCGGLVGGEGRCPHGHTHTHTYIYNTHGGPHTRCDLQQGRFITFFFSLRPLALGPRHETKPTPPHVQKRRLKSHDVHGPLVAV